MNNRILAMLLAIIMIIGIVPVTADAACKHADYTTFAAKEATCTTDGNVEYYKCNNCGARSLQKNFKQIVEDTSILYTKATGHSRKWVVTDSEHYQICEKCDDIVVSSKGNHSLKATNNGETHDLDCTVEGCPYEVKAAAHVDGSVKDCKCGYCGAIMHDLKLVEAKAATCTETGMKAYYACENCVAKFDAETKEQTTTAALTTEKVEHDASWEITETEHRKYCKNCNATHLAKENHTFSYKDNP